MLSVGANDAVLILSLLYLCVDLQCDWEAFHGCARPIHKWLMGSYVLVILSRLVYVAGMSLRRPGSDSFLLDLRQKDAAKTLMSVTWTVIMPAFAAWSVLGTCWIWAVQKETPQCLPSGAQVCFLVIWQVLSYLWVLIHCGLGAVAWLLERRLRRAEGDLRELEDPDVLARWGQVSRLEHYSALQTPGCGLTAAQILKLPGLKQAVLEDSGEAGEECPICLNCVTAGEQVRELELCGHKFHRSCIDLWLLRSAACPMCKGAVEAV